MFLFRSLSVGLIGACCLLLATRPQTAMVLASSPPIVVMSPASDDPAACEQPVVTVIDVAPSVTGEMVAQLIALAANEHIMAIDDVPVRDGRATLSALALEGRQYVDVEIANDAGGRRRVLVLAAK